MTYIEDLRAKWAQQAADQETVNNIYRDRGVTATMQAIRELACASHAHYPQYAGYWEGPRWTLARFTTQVRSKGGVQGEPGDIVLYRCLSMSDSQFYSVRIGCMCAVSYGLLPLMSRYDGKSVGQW